MTTPIEVLDKLIRNARFRSDPYWAALAAECIVSLDAAGLRVVPEVPTPEMIAAGRAEIKPDNLPADDGDVRACWEAMLAAVPKPPEGAAK